MLKRPLCGLAVCFLLGIVSNLTVKWYGLFAVIAILIVMAAWTYEKKQLKRGCVWIFLFLGVFLLGDSRYERQWQIRQACQIQLVDASRVVVQGTLDKKESKNNQFIYYLKDCYVSFSSGILPCNQIIAYSDTDKISIGKTLIINGTIEYFEAALNEGNYDEKSYYESLGIDFKLTDIKIEKCFGKEQILCERLYNFRKKVKEVYETFLAPEDVGVISAMTLGDKAALDAEIKSLYQVAGISHALSISGLHLSTIGMSLYQLLRKMGVSYAVSGAASGSCILLYGIIVGCSASTMRAVLMFLLMLIAQMTGRSYDSLNALAIAAMCQLWANPFLVQYAGFLFSYAAVLGVVLVGKIVMSFFTSTKKIGKTLLMSFVIQLTTIPLVAIFYSEIPVYSMFMNLVIIPFLNLLLILALLGGIAGLKVGVVAEISFYPCHWILLYTKKMCELCRKLPKAGLITGKPEMKQLFFYYLILSVVLFWLWRKKEEEKKTYVPQKELSEEEKLGKRKERQKTKLIMLTGFALANIILFWKPRTGIEIDVLSVGQGDGIYLQTKAGYQIFIDGGSSDVSKVGTYRMLPFLKAKGVKKIDYWFVSHADSDHISGLQELLETGYPVETLIFSKEIIKEEAYENLCQLAEKNHTKLCYLEQGDCLHLGDGKITCLFPDATFGSPDKNAMSLVLEYEEDGFSAMFTGDMDLSAEKRLLTSGLLSDIDFYKVAHHGSNNSNSTELLEQIKPEVAVISCGRNNRYGHPGQEAVERIESVGARIFYTMEAGQVTVKWTDGELIVEEYLLRDEY